MGMSEEAFLNELASTVDRHRLEITQVLLVVREVQGKWYEVAAANMAIPMLYAHWEGFVREALEMYMEFLEARQLTHAEVAPSIVAHSVKRELMKLVGTQSWENLTGLVEALLGRLNSRLQLPERTVDTKSNLKFNVLMSLCDSLCIDVSALKDRQKMIDALVWQRNNVAHGASLHNVGLETVEEYARFVVETIEAVEEAIRQAVKSESYRLKAAHTLPIPAVASG